MFCHDNVYLRCFAFILTKLPSSSAITTFKFCLGCDVMFAPGSVGTHDLFCQLFVLSTSELNSVFSSCGRINLLKSTAVPVAGSGCYVAVICAREKGRALPPSNGYGTTVLNYLSFRPG